MDHVVLQRDTMNTMKERATEVLHVRVTEGLRGAIENRASHEQRTTADMVRVLITYGLFNMPTKEMDRLPTDFGLVPEASESDDVNHQVERS
jgi:hypothetical protein